MAGLHIVIVGAGLGGLMAACSLRLESTHSVTVLEAAAKLQEVGAGLQLTPNATKLLLRLGLRDALAPKAAEPVSFTFHRYSDGKRIGHRQNYGAEMQRKFKAPFWDMHRADLQQALYKRATELGVKFRFGAKVSGYEFSEPSATLKTGEVVEADLIIAADGLWSLARETFMGHPDPPLPTGDLAYRIVLDHSRITDPELKPFIEKPSVHLWAGPEAHVIYYNLRGGTMNNIVLLVPDNLPPEVSRAPADIDEMRTIFKDWDPILNKFLDLVPSVDKWRLMHHPELPSWTNEQGTIVLLGDACHPMLPYLAQGANSALEDGVVLGRLLSTVKEKSDLPGILRKYEDLRKPRSSFLHKYAMKQRHLNHLPDGEEQQRRDELLEREFEEPSDDYPFYWVNPQMQEVVYGYDANAEAERVLSQL
ncbi:FAD/NAD(P)-binding domain-containing protein [Lepidopterella palustris CBS 459.81]|uniref:FAD/NAD(P)-binding domain-containing protein n=1 Tax=Lepidopterella palustris CBS 459.81 TaxID=1314670 RepID=A0A8E2E0S7_9PEZI|nr:FAD/NAD(P)-binding domain-containing protein [Lepidopterella palustris CBS 459.81]